MSGGSGDVTTAADLEVGSGFTTTVTTTTEEVTTADMFETSGDITTVASCPEFYTSLENQCVREWIPPLEMSASFILFLTTNISISKYFALLFDILIIFVQQLIHYIFLYNKTYFFVFTAVLKATISLRFVLPWNPALLNVTDTFTEVFKDIVTYVVSFH